jgi:hypothetical protein
MSNQFQSVTAGLAQLKNYYQGPIIDLLNEDTPVYRAAEKVKQGWSGYQVVRPLRVRRNQGIGATSDGGNLPNIGRQTTVQANILAKFNYLRFGITGPMIKSSASDVGSFVRSAAYELKMGYQDLQADINRQLSWDGSGDLATLNAAASATTSIVIKGRESTEPALKFVDVGLVFDIVDGSGNYKAQSVSVVSISSGTASSATATIVLDTPVTAAADDIIIRAGSKDQEMQGMLTALDGGTSTIYGVDRSLYPAYQGNVSALAGAQLTLDAMQTPFNEGLRRGSVGSYNAIYTDFASLKMYQKLLTPDKRYTNTVEGDGTFGKKGKFYMEFNGISVVPDKDCPTRFFFVPAEVFKLYELCAMEFADETGSMYIAQTDTDSLEVRIRHFANLFNEQPAACAVLSGYIAP